MTQGQRVDMLMSEIVMLGLPAESELLLVDIIDREGGKASVRSIARGIPGTRGCTNLLKQ